VVILILPAVIYFAIVHRFLVALKTYSAALATALLTYPADPSVRRAYTVRDSARVALTLRLWLHVLAQFGIRAGGLEKWGGASLATLVVIALLPVSALAAVLDALYEYAVLGPRRACSRAGDHLRANAPYYVLAVSIIGSGVGVYYLIGYVNEIVVEDARRPLHDPFRLHKQILEELAELRADVRALQLAQRGEI
jgi:hypothetical protein